MTNALDIPYAPGTVVALNSYVGPISRVVVRDYGNVIAVCRKEELEEACRNGRVPNSVGFRKTDIIKTIPCLRP